MKQIVPAALAFLTVTATALAQAPSSDSPTDSHIHSRAYAAVIWGIAGVSTRLRSQEMLPKAASKMNQVIYWGRPLDWRNQTLTPNPDGIYFMVFFDTKEVGPIVLEVPPGDSRASLTGNIMTEWQVALEDVGLLGDRKSVV